MRFRPDAGTRMMARGPARECLGPAGSDVDTTVWAFGDGVEIPNVEHPRFGLRADRLELDSRAAQRASRAGLGAGFHARGLFK